MTNEFESKRGRQNFRWTTQSYCMGSEDFNIHHMEYYFVLFGAFIVWSRAAKLLLSIEVIMWVNNHRIYLFLIFWLTIPLSQFILIMKDLNINTNIKHSQITLSFSFNFVFNEFFVCSVCLMCIYILINNISKSTTYSGLLGGSY